jgi:hypothetical protein
MGDTCLLVQVNRAPVREISQSDMEAMASLKRCTLGQFMLPLLLFAADRMQSSPYCRRKFPQELRGPTMIHRTIHQKETPFKISASL